MRIFKSKYEYIWESALSEHGNCSTTEKDWTKIDILSDTKIAEEYKKTKKRAKMLEEILDKLTNKYEISKNSKEDASDILEYMGTIIDLLKIEYFFIHSFQEIISIRKVIKQSSMYGNQL